MYQLSYITQPNPQLFQLASQTLRGDWTNIAQATYETDAGRNAFLTLSYQNGQTELCVEDDGGSRKYIVDFTIADSNNLPHFFNKYAAQYLYLK